ncbi:hypothetical protein ACIBF7_26885 [Nonomuraea sp. NPDC050478]|uniref:hypothetical protein n=1 Tax=Nonomuraea sp. NPDC050478 TaxID=3364365 RepID=UPI0037A29D45
MTPMPVAYGPPFICDYIPKIAVERMTGVTDPRVSGSLGLEDPPAVGACIAYERTDERRAVLRIALDTGGVRGYVESLVRDGAGKRLPEIIPGAIGYYGSYPGEEGHVGSMLVKGKSRLSVELLKGVKGRDNAADVVAFMKLIGPKLMPTSSAGEDG